VTEGGSSAISNPARAVDALGETTAADDGELMRRVQHGEADALSVLMERWELPVKRVIARIVFNARDAEEIAQETFVRVWQNRSRFRAGAEFRPWAFSIAINLARNRLRWWRRRPEIALEEWTDHETQPSAGAIGSAQREDSLEGAERVTAVRDAVAQLPTDLREALVLSEYEQMSHAEVAAALGCTPKAVESRLYRAREKLRKSLQTQLAAL
jgi:RNA polymerase sigma factor (sigma-70 family)